MSLKTGICISGGTKRHILLENSTYIVRCSKIEKKQRFSDEQRGAVRECKAMCIPESFYLL